MRSLQSNPYSRTTRLEFNSTEVEFNSTEDLPKQDHFQFLALLEEDIAWPYRILQTDKADFHSYLSFAFQQRRIREKPNISQLLPFLFPKMTVWLGLRQCAVSPYFSAEFTSAYFLICTVNTNHYVFRLPSDAISEFQQCKCQSSTGFMQEHLEMIGL